MISYDLEQVCLTIMNIKLNRQLNTNRFAILIKKCLKIKKGKLIVEKMELTRQPILCVLMSFFKTNTLSLKHTQLTTKDIKINKEISKYKLLH